MLKIRLNIQEFRINSLIMRLLSYMLDCYQKEKEVLQGEVEWDLDMKIFQEVIVENMGSAKRVVA